MTKEKSNSTTVKTSYVDSGTDKTIAGRQAAPKPRPSQTPTTNKKNK